MRIRQHLTRIVIFLSIILLLDRISGEILKKLYYTQRRGQGCTITRCFTEIQSEIVILGNSRAQHHYVSDTISDRTNLSCFNAGIDGGQSILFVEALVRGILARYTPKLFIIEFNPRNGLLKRHGDYDKLSRLLPYYEDYPVVRPIIELRGEYETIKLFSKIYPYNSLLIDIVRFNTDYHAERKIDFNGYVPLEGSLGSEAPGPGIARFDNKKETLDMNKIRSLENILKECSQTDVKVVILNSPIYANEMVLSTNYNDACISINRFQTIIHKYGVSFYDFSNNDSFVNRPQLFKDYSHLNGSGAQIYSDMIADVLGRELSGKHYYGEGDLMSRNPKSRKNIP